MSSPARIEPEGKSTRTRLVDPWRVSLWAVQLVLAAVFGDDGLAKTTQPIAALADRFV
jgi:hypothetical protein